MELYQDQINSPSFMDISDYIWSDRIGDEYIQSVYKKHNLQIVNKDIKPKKSGVLFLGMGQIIEDIFDKIKSWHDSNSYIVVYAPQDRSFTQKMYERKPHQVKHIYTTNCQVKAGDVSAYPIGIASIGSYDYTLDAIGKENVQNAQTKVFVRYNYNNNGYTEERKSSIAPLKYKTDFIKIIENQIPADEFLRNVKAHRFTMSLRGEGADTLRTWMAMSLGSIPIVSDCIEMRFFEDMPLVYCPKDIYNELTEEWLDSIDVSGKSTERVRMSYWKKHVENKRNDLRI